MTRGAFAYNQQNPMGRPIVYCDACGKLLREEDFAKGRAHEVDHRNFCVECRPLPGAPPATPRGTPLPPQKKASSSRTPVAPPHRPGSKSGHLAVPPAPPPSRTGLYAGLAAGGLLLIGIIVAIASSGSGAPAVTEELRLKGPTRPPAEPERPPAAEEVSREPFLKAVAYRRMNPNDLGGQIRELENAIRALAGSRHEEDAKRELAAVRTRIENELAEIEKQAAPFAAGEEFGKALSLLDAARRRFEYPGWLAGLEPKIARVRAALEAAKADVRARAEDARKRKSAPDLDRLSARVSRWEIPEEEATLAVHLILSPPGEPAPPPPPPPTPPPPPAPEAPRAEVLAHAAARDYAAALAALGEHKEDAELLRLAQAAAHEGAAALLRSPRGKKLAVEYRDPTGAPAKIDDLLLRADATRLEMKFGDSSVVIPIGEVSARTLAEAVRSKDPRGADALRWVEGDVDGLPLPPRMKGAGPPPDDAARRLFYDAEAAIFDPERAGWAKAAYRALLEEQGSTSFVRRNKAAILARLEVPKDLIFLADELAGSGGFKLVPNRRVERCWTSEKDTEARKDNFVELGFASAGEKPPRIFLFVGGCCAEVFTAFVSGTDLDGELPLKHTITGLKRKHGDHLGPKEPDRWEWMTFTPKYPAAGPKTLRILTEQKGFSIAMAVVSTERTTPPRDLEPAEVLRRRAEIPGYLNRGGARLGMITCETWKGIPHGDVGQLRNAPGFPDTPTERKLIPAFEIPRDTGDDYGTRIHGYVYPPAAGDYVFWISSDDQSELWLSTDDDPKNKVLIARAPEWQPPHEYGKFPEQKSNPVRLEAGRRYYVEALHKEGGGGDHVSVRWTLPDGKVEQPIPGSRLSPWTGPKR